MEDKVSIVESIPDGGKGCIVIVRLEHDELNNFSQVMHDNGFSLNWKLAEGQPRYGT